MKKLMWLSISLAALSISAFAWSEVWVNVSKPYVLPLQSNVGAYFVAKGNDVYLMGAGERIKVWPKVENLKENP